MIGVGNKSTWHHLPYKMRLHESIGKEKYSTVLYTVMCLCNESGHMLNGFWYKEIGLTVCKCGASNDL